LKTWSIVTLIKDGFNAKICYLDILNKVEKCLKKLRLI
jgi:hypothetical protein